MYNTRSAWPHGRHGIYHSPAVSLLSCTEESSLLMYLSSISATMSGRSMAGDLRASTSSDQVGLGEDWSHSLSIAVRRSPEVWWSSSIACNNYVYNNYYVVTKLLCLGAHGSRSIISHFLRTCKFNRDRELVPST